MFSKGRIVRFAKMFRAHGHHYHNDALQPMTPADLLLYRNICAERLPSALSAHHFLTLHSRWQRIFAENSTIVRGISPKCVNSFYVPRMRNVDHCTIVAISNELSAVKSPRHCIFVFTLERPAPKELIDCLQDTQRIAWQSEPLFEVVHERIAPAVRDLVVTQKGQRICDEWSEMDHCRWLSKEEAMAADVSIPDELCFGELNEGHAVAIDERWPYRDASSHNYIRSLIQLNGGLGLFERTTKRLLAWVLINDHFAVGFLETIPSERRKGLGGLLLREHCRRFTQGERIDAITYVNEENTESLNVSTRVGFRTFQRCEWIQVRNAL